MTKDKDTYTHIPDALVRQIGAEPALIACRLSAFEKDGEVRVSMAYLSQLFGIDKRRISAIAATLQTLGIWTNEKGDGRGCVTKWKKGANYESFLKPKRVQILQKKGTKSAPYNKITLRDNNIGAPACASTPTTMIKNLEIMKEFEEFWSAYQPTAEFQHERERCERLWLYMSELLRADIIKSVKRQKPTKSPYCYLRYYKSQDLRLMPSGSRVEYDRYYKFYSTTENRDGWVLQVVKDVRGNDKAIYIKQ